MYASTGWLAGLAGTPRTSMSPSGSPLDHAHDGTAGQNARRPARRAELVAVACSQAPVPRTARISAWAAAGWALGRTGTSKPREMPVAAAWRRFGRPTSPAGTIISERPPGRRRPGGRGPWRSDMLDDRARRRRVATPVLRAPSSSAATTVNISFRIPFPPPMSAQAASKTWDRLGPRAAHPCIWPDTRPSSWANAYGGQSSTVTGQVQKTYYGRSKPGQPAGPSQRRPARASPPHVCSNPHRPSSQMLCITVRCPGGMGICTARACGGSCEIRGWRLTCPSR
jgi:hypothetical protein